MARYAPGTSHAAGGAAPSTSLATTPNQHTTPVAAAPLPVRGKYDLPGGANLDPSLNPANSQPGWGLPVYGGWQGQMESEADRAARTSDARTLRAQALGASAGQSSNVNQAYAGQERQGQLSALDRLRGFYQQGPGPSAAEAQLRMGADASMGNALALARSGRGAGGGAVAMRNAGFQNAATMQQTNAQAGALRAQEAANWRGQQAQAMGLEQQGYGSLRGQDIQAGLGYGQLGQGYEQLGQQSGQFGDTLRGQIFGQQLSADTARYGADRGFQGGQLQADVASRGQNMGLLGAGLSAAGAVAGTLLAPGVGTVAGAAAGSAAGNAIKSDIHAKKDIHPAEASSSLRSVFAPAADLRPAQAYSYQYKDPSSPGAGPGTFVGPMAQDLEKTPAGASAVVNTPQGKGVDTGRLALVNSSAISETQNRQDELEQRINALQGLLRGGR